jgi:potassium efflux system protein
MKSFSRSSLVWAALFLWTSHLQAQSPALNTATGVASESAGESHEPAEGDDQTKRAQISEELRAAQRTLDSAKQQTSEQPNAKLPERLQREVELLKQLDVVVAQQEVAKTESDDLRTRLSDLEGRLSTIRDTGPSKRPPYSFLLLDQLRDELSAKRTRTEAIEVATEASGEAIAQAKQSLEVSQQALRRANEVEQSNALAEKRVEFATVSKFADFETRIATETLEFRRLSQVNQRIAQELHHRQVAILEEKVGWISKGAIFSDRDLQDQMLEVDKQEEDLRSDLRSAESELQYAEIDWSRARHQLDMSLDKGVELVEQVEAKQLTRQLYQTKVSLLNVHLQRRGLNRESWQRRFHVIGSLAKTDELIEWAKDARAGLAQLDREKRLEQMRIDELRQDIASRDKKLQTAGEDSAQARRWIEQQRDAFTQLIRVHDANIVSIESSKRLSEKLLAEIEGDVQTWSLGEWLESAGHYVGKTWNTELLTVDEHPLTSGKVIVGIILVVVGFIVSRMLSRALGGRLQRGRIGMHESAASALQSLSFYVLLVCFTLMSLRFVNVPLTMFTFLGGAIAIGVGLGSQNILNNFISGLILLAERPIRVGDLIQLENLHGVVEHIGTRSTRIKTASNMEIIVPNSSFLENNVLNHTLGDNKVRAQVRVGIAYGSPTREAARLMVRAAKEHGVVLTRPKPFVWFQEFGDNSLNFDLHFWVEVRNLSEQMRVESDVRFKIDHLFRDAGITIAFPQRDVHFDVSQPISVEVVSPSAPSISTEAECGMRSAE